MFPICVLNLADADSFGSRLKARFTRILNHYLEKKGVLTPFEERNLPYHNSPHDYYVPWLACNYEEREAANNLGRSTFYKPELEFPEFKRTPEALRNLIKRCTIGAREWSAGPFQIYRRESRNFPRGKTGLDGQPTAIFEETEKVIKQTWLAEADKIIGFVEANQRYDNGEPRPADFEYLGYLKRPKLHEVLDELEKFQI